MINLGDNLVKLDLYETKVLVALRSFSPETYVQKMHIEANSILSTVFVETLDPGASVKINYYDTTTGEDEGERFELNGHDLITVPTLPNSNRELITKIHNKPVVEIVVSGGNVKLGLYITAISSIASDLDAALKKDSSVATLLTDKGIPIITYDESQNMFYILRSVGGTLPVSFSEAGTSIQLAMSGDTTPGVSQDLITDTVPGGKTRNIDQVIVSCRSHGRYIVTSDSEIIASGRTGPANPKDSFSWSPRRVAVSGKVLKVSFTADSSSPINSIEAYLMASDV